MANIKNTISNVVAVVVAVGTVVATALNSVPENSEWYVWAAAVAIAILGWLTGKNTDLSK